MASIKVAYILAGFPSRTETFAFREIECLRNKGCDIRVLAAKQSEGISGGAESVPVTYRPSIVSFRTVFSVLYLLRHYPLAPLRYLSLVLRVLLESPREAMLLLCNIHTVAYFIRYLDKHRIKHVHGYFLSWPACIALAVSHVSKRSFSIAAHARDIFVESCAAKLKTKLAKFITTCTNQGLECLRELSPPAYHHKLHLVRHGIEIRSPSVSVEAYLRYSRATRDKHRIIAVGRLVPKKGFEYLIGAISHLRKRLPECKVVIVGHGPDHRRLTEIISSLAMDDCIEMVGWLGHDEVIDLMRSAAVLVVPSVVAADGDRDGIPNVILEAFDCGLPVVASRLPGIMEAVKHDKTGLLVTPEHVGELEYAIKRLMQDDELQAQLSLQALRVLANDFEITRNVEDLVRIFKETA